MKNSQPNDDREIDGESAHPRGNLSKGDLLCLIFLAMILSAYIGYRLAIWANFGALHFGVSDIWILVSFLVFAYLVLNNRRQIMKFFR